MGSHICTLCVCVFFFFFGGVAPNCMILRTETGLMSETNLLKFQLVHETFYFSFLRFAKHTPYKERWDHFC